MVVIFEFCTAAMTLLVGRVELRELLLSTGELSSCPSERQRLNTGE